MDIARSLYDEVTWLANRFMKALFLDRSAYGKNGPGGRPAHFSAEQKRELNTGQKRLRFLDVAILEHRLFFSEIAFSYKGKTNSANTGIPEQKRKHQTSNKWKSQDY